ncbi:MAG: HlyD family type I secretion periplasmic adaptor subunit [Alphaproteobacteria bacterium]|nr:MAG: HlyD family type I secretion periplasmic adaptor subunit [Alphaproteobacteria bacterium]
MSDRLVERQINEFLPDALAVAGKPLPWFARGLLYLVLAMIVTGVVASILVKIDVAVVAPGQIATSEPLIVIQPTEIMTIREIKVAVGDRVAAGDPIVVFDPTIQTADLDSLIAEERYLRARIARLEAELAGEAQPATPSDAAAEFVSLETRLARDRGAEYQARISGYAAKIDEVRREMDSVRGERETSKLRIEVLNEILKMREQLFDRDVGSRLAVLQTRAEVLAVQQDQERLNDREAVLAKTLEVVEAERAAFESNWQRETAADLVEARRTQSRVITEIVKGRRRQDLVNLRAPVDAIVLERADLSVGSVVEPAKPIATLVPTNSVLHGKVLIETKDIGLIKVGDPVRVKFEAFPFEQHGVANGRIGRIAPSTAAQGSETAPPRYVALVDIDLDNLPPGITDVRPGMIVTAEILTGKRSVISYLLNPVVRAFDEALQEPR